MIRAEEIRVRTYSPPRGGWATVTRRVYRHDGCDTDHFILQVARACEAKCKRKDEPTLFRVPQ